MTPGAGLAQSAGNRNGVRIAPRRAADAPAALRARPQRRGPPFDHDERTLSRWRACSTGSSPHRWGDRKWVADFTYIWTTEGWRYVALVLDLSRRMVNANNGERTADHRGPDDGDLATAANAPLHLSNRGRRCAREPSQRLHCGSKCALQHGAPGNVGDDVVTEGLFSSLKTDCIARKLYSTHDHARANEFDNLERLYNPKRCRSTPGYLTPGSSKIRAISSGNRPQSRMLSGSGTEFRLIGLARPTYQ
jgi:putative transposase